MTESFAELNADLYDRVLLYTRVFEDEFIYSLNEAATQQQQPQPANDDHKVLLIKITNPLTTKSLVVNVGGPHRENDRAGIYAPTWILEALDIHDIGDVTWQKVQTPPVRATKIYLKPLDPMMDHIDARAEIEEAIDGPFEMGMWLTAPEVVTCAYCHAEFPTRDMRSPEDE